MPVKSLPTSRKRPQGDAFVVETSFNENVEPQPIKKTKVGTFQVVTIQYGLKFFEPVQPNEKKKPKVFNNLLLSDTIKQFIEANLGVYGKDIPQLFYERKKQQDDVGVMFNFQPHIQSNWGLLKKEMTRDKYWDKYSWFILGRDGNAYEKKDRHYEKELVDWLKNVFTIERELRPEWFQIAD